MKTSCGVLLFRSVDGAIEVLLAHPGGPFFRNKDAGAWTVPKGELGEGEEPLACALREFREETGIDASGGSLRSLGELKQKGGKRVLVWACEWCEPLDLAALPASNTFELEWPPRSGKRQSFPEVDRLAFFSLADARDKLLTAQCVLLERLEASLAAPHA